MSSNVHSLRLAVAAAALLLGGQALAQAARPTPSPWDRARNPNPGQPAPVPGRTAPTAPAPAAQPPAAAQGTGSAAAQASAGDLAGKLMPLHARNVGYRDVGQLAGERGNNSQVKDLGRKMQQEYQRLDEDLKKLAQERSLPVGDPSQADTAAKDAVLARLRGLSGDAFDTDFVREVIRDLQDDVSSTKQMRDSTPGKDARLKKWLDDAENVMENQLTAARQAKVTIDKARGQARKPPAR